MQRKDATRYQITDYGLQYYLFILLDYNSKLK